MKILIVAGYFAPYCPASASRVNKFAKYMEDKGHDVRVLGPENDSFKPILLPEISRNKIHYTKYTRVNDFPTKVKEGLKALFSKPKTEGGDSQSQVDNSEQKKPKKTRSSESAISILYRKLTNIPDDFVGWYPHAISEGKAMFQEWTPDIIFATLPPFTTMMIAARLGRMIDVPVVYDYRDLWTDHPYYDEQIWRRFVDRALENYALKKCAGLVTVTKTWADYLKDARRIPVEFVMNGFDPADFQSSATESYDPRKITLLYAGHLYGDKRDPAVIFEALGRLGEKAKEFNVLLYTPSGKNDLSDQQKFLLKKHDLDTIVNCHKYIPQKDLLKLQQQVDVLILLRWDDPSENGVIAGKLFEYIGAGRQILVTGSVTGEAADIVRENNFGSVSNDPDEIAVYLENLLDQKKLTGKTEMSENPNREKFTRAKQFEKLVIFLDKIIADYKA